MQTETSFATSDIRHYQSEILPYLIGNLLDLKQQQMPIFRQLNKPRILLVSCLSHLPLYRPWILQSCSAYRIWFSAVVIMSSSLSINCICQEGESHAHILSNLYLLLRKDMDQSYLAHHTHKPCADLSHPLSPNNGRDPCQVTGTHLRIPTPVLEAQTPDYILTRTL